MLHSQHQADKAAQDSLRLDRRIYDTKLGITLLDLIAHKPTQEQLQFKPPKGLAYLAQCLQKANQSNKFSLQEKQAAVDRMKKQGVDLRPIIDNIKEKQATVPHKRILPSREIEKYFEFQPLTLSNQKQFIERNRNIALGTSLNLVLSRSPNSQMEQLRIKMSKQKQIGNQAKPQQTESEINKERARLYYECLADCVKDNSLDRLHCLLYQSLRNANQDWLQTIAEQIESLYEASTKKIEPEIPIVINSLRAFQRQYRRKMNNQNPDINEFFKHHYLMHKSLNAPTICEDGKYPWGIAYVLYTSGLKEEFYESIKHSQNGALRKAFEKHDQNIKALRPQRTTFKEIEPVKDAFFRHLITILEGRAEEEVERPFSILGDKVHMLLRLKGVYNRISKEDKKNIQLSDFPLPIKFNSLLLVGGYEQAHNLFKNSTDYSRQFKSFDHVMWLLLMYLNPELISKEQELSRKGCEQFRNMAVDVIIDYASKIRERGDPNFKHYVTAILLNEANLINIRQEEQVRKDEQLLGMSFRVCQRYFKSTAAMRDFDWARLKELMSSLKQEQHFNTILRYAMSLLRSDTADYDFLSEIWQRFCEDKEYFLELSVMKAIQTSKVKTQKGSSWQGESQIKKLISSGRGEQQVVASFLQSEARLRDTQLQKLLPNGQYNYLKDFQIYEWVDFDLKSSRQQTLKQDQLIKYLLHRTGSFEIYILYLERIFRWKQFIFHTNCDYERSFTFKTKFKQLLLCLEQKYPQIQDYGKEWNRLKQKVAE